MARPKKKDDEVDFTDNGKFKEDKPVPGVGHNIQELNDDVVKAEKDWNQILSEIQALHDKKKELFAGLKAKYGLKRGDLERGFKRKAMDPDKREAQDEADKIINDALGVPSHAVQPDMLGGPDMTMAGKPAQPSVN